MSTAVLIPCRNEESTIAKVVSDYIRVLPDSQVYVCDNNSTDRTAELAASAGAKVMFEQRPGKGFAVRSMFRTIDADVYLMVDGDDTYAPDDVVALTGPVTAGCADMVLGDRLSSAYFSENHRAFHGLGNRLVRWLVNTIFHANVVDVMTGARAFSRCFVQTYPAMSQGFEVETEMTVHALDKGLVIVEMPVVYHERAGESVSKLRTIPDGLRVLKTVLALFKDFRPLLFSGIAAAIILFVPPLAEYVETGLVRRFPSLIVAMALGISSLLALVTGALLDSQRKQSRMWYELELHKWSQAHGTSLASQALPNARD